MPLTVLTAEAAQQNLQGPAARWTDEFVSRRLSDAATVQTRGAFSIEPGDAVFPLGTGFARDLEARLAALGLETPTLPHADPEALDRFGPYALLNEVRWALDPDALFPEDGFLRVGALWCDPHGDRRQVPADLDEVTARRDASIAVHRQLARCRIAVATLSETESWFDRKTGLYLNTAPPQIVLGAEPDRFELHQLSVEEIETALDALCSLLVRFCRPDFHLVLTVSPVPVPVTWTGEDVLTANGYAKAALRAAAAGVAARRPEAHYFPALEIVAHSRSPFADQQRRVAPQVAGAAVEQMLRTYAQDLAPEPGEGSAETPKAFRARVEDARRQGDHAMVANLLKPLQDDEGWAVAGYSEFDFRYLLGRALRQCGRQREAVVEFERAEQLLPDHPALLYNLGHARAQIGQAALAEDCLRRAAELDPSQTRFQLRYAKALIDNGRAKAAEPLLLAILDKGESDEAQALLAGIRRRSRR